jgi:hypothetical protein
VRRAGRIATASVAGFPLHTGCTHSCTLPSTANKTPSAGGAGGRPLSRPCRAPLRRRTVEQGEAARCYQGSARADGVGKRFFGARAHVLRPLPVQRGEGGAKTSRMRSVRGCPNAASVQGWPSRLAGTWPPATGVARVGGCHAPPTCHGEDSGSHWGRHSAALPGAKGRDLDGAARGSRSLRGERVQCGHVSCSVDRPCVGSHCGITLPAGLDSRAPRGRLQPPAAWVEGTVPLCLISTPHGTLTRRAGQILAGGGTIRGQNGYPVVWLCKVSTCIEYVGPVERAEQGQATTKLRHPCVNAGRRAAARWRAPHFRV